MLGAVPGHPPRADLAAVGDELAKQRDVFVVDVGGFVLAEDADLLPQLLLPGLLLFFSLRSSASLLRHPVASPPVARLRRRKRLRRSRRRPGRVPASRSWRWPT